MAEEIILGIAIYVAGGIGAAIYMGRSGEPGYGFAVILWPVMVAALFVCLPFELAYQFGKRMRARP